MSNYACTVVQLQEIRKHTNADRLQIANIFGNNVIVGLDAKPGDVGLFFPLESQIGLEFSKANDLLRRKDPATGKAAGGMFDENRRVRAQTLRGEKSMGFYCPISYLHKTLEANNLSGSLLPAFSEGQEIETYQGLEISKKYVPAFQRAKADSSPKQKGPRVKKKEEYMLPEQFRFHFDTSHYGKNKHKVLPESKISITWKTHGTSGIAANVLVKRDLSFLERIAKRLGVKVQEERYSTVTASRKVIKAVEGVENKQQHQHYYKTISSVSKTQPTSVWDFVVEKHFKGKLKTGETLYYEILGYLPGSESYIQKGYDYGCKVGEYKVQVYRVTNTAADGSVVDMPWEYVKHRAKQLGVEHVPEIFYGRAEDFAQYLPDVTFDEAMYNLVSKNFVYDQDCQFCSGKVPAEGIVIRIEYPDGSIENLKHKNFRFFEHETKALDKGEVDMETEQAEEASAEPVEA